MGHSGIIDDGDGDVKIGTTVRDGIMTSSISGRNIAKLEVYSRKNRPKPKDKHYDIPRSAGLTPEEYAACQKEHNAHLKKPPGYAKQQSDWLCHQYFPIIQETRKEMANYELVEPMVLIVILTWGCWAHMNFKAEHKDAEDSTTAIYFAEIDVPNKEVTNLTKLDIDLSTDTSAYKHCKFCHPDPEEGKHLSIAGYGCVYHPVDGKLVLR